MLGFATLAAQGRLRRRLAAVGLYSILVGDNSPAMQERRRLINVLTLLLKSLAEASLFTVSSAYTAMDLGQGHNMS